MATLDELVHYCNLPHPTGAFMLTGEWGTGKTHLIENELADALEETHVIVRVSLYGMNKIASVHTALKEKWVSACSPILGKLVKDKGQVKSNNGFAAAIGALLKGVNPAAAGAAQLMVSMNVLDMVKIEPQIEDIKEHELKRVVLVFDDLERSKLDLMEMMGLINEYCENRHFSTIIVTNESYLIHLMRNDLVLYYMLKGKTVSRTVFFVPDFDRIITDIIRTRKWSSPVYQNYLQEKKDKIRELFASGQVIPEISKTGMSKSHNLLTLVSALDDFYRIFSHLRKDGVKDPDVWLYSFLAYSLARKSGIFKNGELRLDCTDEEIRELYPMCSPEHLYPSIRNWIVYGIWDKAQLIKEMTESAKQRTEIPEEQ